MTTEDVNKVVDELLAKQKLLDAQDVLVGHEIVKAQNLKTIEEAKRFAMNWVATAARESRNVEYMTGERDKLLKLTTAVTSVEPDSKMSPEQVAFRAEVKTILDAEFGSPEVLRERLKEVREHWKATVDQLAELSDRLDAEKHAHDETRGYRQHTEKLLEDLHTELRATVGSILLDIDDAMADVDPAVSESWRVARVKLVKLKEYA